MTYSILIPFAASLLGLAEPEAAVTAEPTPTAEPAVAAPFEGEPAPAAAEPPASATSPQPDWSASPGASPDAPASPLAPAPVESETAPQTATSVAAAPTVAPIPPRPPRPIRWRLDFGVGVDDTVVIDRGFRAFSSSRNMPGIGASVLFDFRLAQSRVFLGGGLSYQHVGRSGDLYSGLGTAYLDAHEPEVLGRVSILAIEGLDAFARVGVGPSIVSLDVSTFEYASQRAVIPRVDGQAGLSLYLPKAWLPRKQAGRFTVGLQLGAGYTWRGDIDVRPKPLQGEDPIRASVSPLGALSMHGVSWSLGLFARVM